MKLWDTERPVDILFVVDWPTPIEEAQGRLLPGFSFVDFERQCQQAGINPRTVQVISTFDKRPASGEMKEWIKPPTKKHAPGFETLDNKHVLHFIPAARESLLAAIARYSPKVIVPMGNASLWMLTGSDSVDKWRGSMLRLPAGQWCIPTYSPHDCIRNFSWKHIQVVDLKRALRCVTRSEGKPQRNYLIRPTYEQTMEFLDNLVPRDGGGDAIPVVCDVEIKEQRVICVGLCSSRDDAICIPFYTSVGLYWPIEQWVEVVSSLRRVLTAGNVYLANQNISFDIQYLWADFMIWPKAHFDTMIAQNVLYSGTTKSLDYLASGYCDWYVYWKDDGKFWKEDIEDERLWRYNCDDVTYTFEVMEKQQAALKAAKLEDQMAEQMEILNCTLQIMMRGVRVNVGLKNAMLMEIQEITERLRAQLTHLTGVDLWAEKGLSSARIAQLFYGQMKFPPVLHPATKRPTCDDEALKKFAKQDPIVLPLVNIINMIRSYATAANVCLARVDRDGRWRTSYNVAGTSTYRFSSSENPFGSGTNLQNVTSGRKILEN